jgi:hypothetical protein
MVRMYKGSCIYSAVGIATGYGLDDRRVGFLVTVWSRILISPNGRGPPTQANPMGKTYHGREADRSSPISAEVEKIWVCKSIPHRPSWRNA